MKNSTSQNVKIGDIVSIVTGRLKGTEKTVSGFFRIRVPNMYNVFVDYLTFTDGTRTPVENCKINGTPVITKLWTY